MEDVEFLSELRQMVLRRGESSNLVDTIAFVSEVAERLEEDPVFGEFILAEDSRQGAKNKLLKLHGFTDLDESDGTLSMVIGRWVDDDEPSTLRTSDVDQMRAWLENFAAEALDGGLDDRITESSPAYQLASTLRRKRSSIACIRFHIFANQSLSRAYKRESRSEIAGTPTEIHIWDLQRLKALYESSREREVLQIELAEFGSDGIQCIEASKDERLQSFLCVIDGSLLADLFERYGSRLLEGNVRSFLGMKGGVNKGIRTTIQDAPQLFFAYNNGIAATAASVAIESVGAAARITDISDLQIVNGGQTTASILRARKQDRLSLAGVSVPMKLTVVASNEAHDLIPKIAEYANTQNKVAIADFFANHPFHRKMEEISRRLMVPARAGARVQSKWFYERSRGQFQNERLYLTKAKKDAFDLEYPPRQVLNKTELAKYDSTLNGNPHWVSLGAQKNFIKFAAKFSSKGDKTEAQRWDELSPAYGDAYYQRIAAVAILWKAGETTVSAAKGLWYEGDYRPQIVAYAWSLIFSALRKVGREPDLAKVWEQQEADESLLQVFKRAAVLAQRALLDLPEGSSNVGEWAKKEACWEKVAAISFSLDKTAIEWSIDKEEHKSEARGAKQQGVQDDGISLQQQILGKSVNGYWQALLKWGSVNDYVFGPELELVRRAASPTTAVRLATDRDWKRLREIGERCEAEGFRHHEIESV
ncbi:AIPR family protein [Luteimonas sp. MC1825]|uniref:AIPR family protein n=1 Tax=Luteimonas sp. MC1825 TaxID=2761107 RepID=UPI00160AED80|nr:AIPR family protein [Luteimonas sp. MC1825]MBB6599608.1 AIPR family protein [Luteimonas sp. MC1825]QOC87300.1 AIPR family protein [Luteimonas sp. MC1825]